MGFNVQPNGDSAIWAITRNATNATALYIDDCQIPATVHGGGELVTAIAPQSVLATVGTHRVFLVDPVTRIKSNELSIMVVPSKRLDQTNSGKPATESTRK